MQKSPKTIDDMLGYIRNHRCFTHPIFKNWAAVNPPSEVVGALFHQIQTFCASTRPGWSLPQALQKHGLTKQSQLLEEIVESESDHGPELAKMAGFLVNRRANRVVCSNLDDAPAVERQLRVDSDRILGSLPGYDPVTGLMRQTRKAIQVFDGRKRTDRESTLRNLGSALALEMISNGQLIPGEKHALIDSGLYGATMDDPEMHYLLEHYGEIGAEQQHEKNAVAAVAAVLNDETRPLIMEGVDDFLDSLVSLWDLLDSALLASGYREEIARGTGAASASAA
jgi:hypothetical protein